MRSGRESSGDSSRTTVIFGRSRVETVTEFESSKATLDPDALVADSLFQVPPVQSMFADGRLAFSTKRLTIHPMAKMRAVQVPQAKGPLEIVERDIPEPQPGWVRLKVEACGVCHSDSLTKEGLGRDSISSGPGS